MHKLSIRLHKYIRHCPTYQLNQTPRHKPYGKFTAHYNASAPFLYNNDRFRTGTTGSGVRLELRLVDHGRIRRRRALQQSSQIQLQYYRRQVLATIMDSGQARTCGIGWLACDRCQLDRAALLRETSTIPPSCPPNGDPSRPCGSEQAVTFSTPSNTSSDRVSDLSSTSLLLPQPSLAQSVTKTSSLSSYRSKTPVPTTLTTSPNIGLATSPTPARNFPSSSPSFRSSERLSYPSREALKTLVASTINRCSFCLVHQPAALNVRTNTILILFTTPVPYTITTNKCSF